MTRQRPTLWNGTWLAASACACTVIPGTAGACAACYGQSDSPMAAGMNWGILSLLGIIVAVLGGIAACFIVVARRSSSVPRESIEATLAAQAEASWPALAGGSDMAEADDEPLAERGRLKPVSVLARQRSHCATGTRRRRFGVSRSQR